MVFVISRATMRMPLVLECLPWLGPIPKVAKRLTSAMLSNPSWMEFFMSLSCTSSSRSTNAMPLGWS